MDPISQGALGAATATSMAPGRQVLFAGGLGILAGMAPDLDVLIRSPHDPLLFFEYHRQFTHALAFAPLGALICALAAHLPVRRWLAFRRTYLYCLLGYTSHGLLDACTSYGTQLLWPFSDARLAWNWVSVIDPLFTGPLLVLLAFAAVQRRPVMARLALAWALAYLALGVFQGHRAHQAVLELAANRGHQPVQVDAKPSFGNLLVWKTIYAADGWFYVDAVRLGVTASVYPGERARRVHVPRDFPGLDPDSQQATDIERFRRFSSGYLALDPARANRIIDVRYSMVPNEVDPLWGIRISPGAKPGRHVTFFTERQLTPAHRQALLDMLAGRGSPSPLRPRGEP